MLAAQYQNPNSAQDNAAAQYGGMKSSEPMQDFPSLQSNAQTQQAFPAPAPAQPAPAPAQPIITSGKKQQGGKKNKNKNKNKGSASASGAAAPAQTTQQEQDQQREITQKVFELSSLVDGVSQQCIRDALLAHGGNMDAAMMQLLDESQSKVKSETNKPVSAAPTKHKVLSIGGTAKPETPSASTGASAAPTAAPVPKSSSSSEPVKKPKAVPAKSTGASANSTDNQAVKKDSYAKFVSKLEKLNVDPRDSSEKPNVNLVVVGHVDAGKSTLMGHLLYKLKYVSQREMHKFQKEAKELNKGSFAYAWVLDEHEDERERGVTVEVGVKYFETEKRFVTLLDAPGHRDFIPNMISGAAQGDVAVLVVPANTGEFESSFQHNGQTKEHAILVRYCGIRRLVIAVNKMDMCGWSKARFDEVKNTLLEFLLQGGYAAEDLVFVPVSGLEGLNLVERLPEGTADWYKGPCVTECIDAMPPVTRPAHKPLRMVVADIFKTILLGSMTVSGKIEAGVIQEGESVMVAPSMQLAKVKGIHRHRGKELVPTKFALAGENVDVGLQGLEDTMIGLTSILCEAKFPIPVVQYFEAEIATFDGLSVPLLNGTQVQLHAQSCQVVAHILKLASVRQKDGKDKANPRFIRKNQTATVFIQTQEPICIERYDDFRPLSRILLRQNGVTVAAGRVLDFKTTRKKK